MLWNRREDDLNGWHALPITARENDCPVWICKMSISKNIILMMTRSSERASAVNYESLFVSRRGVSGLAGVVEGRMKHSSEQSEIPRDDCFGLGSVPTKRAFFFFLSRQRPLVFYWFFLLFSTCRLVRRKNPYISTLEVFTKLSYCNYCILSSQRFGIDSTPPPIF